MGGNKGKDKATSQATTGKKKKKNKEGGSSSAPPPLPPPMPPVDRTGYLSIECPYRPNPDIRYQVRDGCQESCPEFSAALNSFGNFHINTTSQQGGATYYLDNVRYDNTLEEWIATRFSIWDADNTRFHEDPENENRGWNLCRPTQECTMMIRGIIKAVLHFHLEQRNGHGNLIQSNILVSSVFEQDSGKTSGRARVKLIKRTRNSCDVHTDMTNLVRIIFKNILNLPDENENEGVPEMWRDLRRQLLAYTGTDWDHTQIILDHPATWEWTRRAEYIEDLYMRTQQDPNPQYIASSDLGQYGRIRRVIETVTVDPLWQDRIPNDTPLYAFLFDADGNRRYGNTTFELFKYTRNVMMHLRELERGRLYPVFIYIGGHHLYEQSKFVEAVLTECFPHFLLDIYERMVTNRVRI